MAVTVYINKDWTSQDSITELTNPFGVETGSLVFGTNAFGDPATGWAWDTATFRFAANDSSERYETLIPNSGKNSSLFSVAYQSNVKLFINAITNTTTLTVNSASIEAEWVTNSGSCTLAITGSQLNVTNALTNNGTLSVGNSSTVTANSLANGGACHITITASTFKVTEATAFTNEGYLTIENSSTFEVDSIVNNPFCHITVSNSTLKVSGATPSITNNGVLTITGGTVEAGPVTNEAFRTISMDASSRIIATSIANNSTFTIDATGFIGMKKVIDLPGSSAAITGNTPTVTGGSATLYYHADTSDYFLLNLDKSTVYVNSTWTGRSFGDEVGTLEYYGYNAFDIVADAVKEAPLPIVVEGGSFGTDNAPTFNGVATTISGGKFETSVCGGTFFSTGGGDDTIGIGCSFDVTENKITLGEKKDIDLDITGGSFTKNVFAGDRVNVSNPVVRYGDITTTISSGRFDTAVAGGMAYTLSSMASSITLIGDVSLTISNAEFIESLDSKGFRRDWIYGGCLASKKDVAGKTIIKGNVTVTLDANANDISVGNLVAGSYGNGKIKQDDVSSRTDETGNVTLVVTGTNNVTATGEIWGGCSGDYYDSYGEYTTNIDGKRTLSFTGFQGTLQCDKIRAFNYAEFVKNGGTATTAILNGYSGSGLNMRYVENWSFDEGCSLTGSFANNFTGDTFTFGSADGRDTFIAAYSDSESGFVVFNDGGNAAANHFAYAENSTTNKVTSGFSAVTLFGLNAEWDGSGYATAAVSESLCLKLSYDTSNNMTVSLAAVSA